MVEIRECVDDSFFSEEKRRRMKMMADGASQVQETLDNLEKEIAKVVIGDEVKPLSCELFEAI